MAIEFRCPSGHRLRVDDRHAGKRIRCPNCQLAVVIPRLENALSDSSVARILGDYEPVPLPERTEAPRETETRLCPRCLRTVPASHRICDFCQLYFVPEGGTHLKGA